MLFKDLFRWNEISDQGEVRPENQHSQISLCNSQDKRGSESRPAWLLQYQRIERRCELDAREAARGVEGVAVEGNEPALQRDRNVAAPRRGYR